MTRITTRRDPHITSTDSRVDAEEMRTRHSPPAAMSAEGVTIGIQDTGLDTDHPRIQANADQIAAFSDYTGAGTGDAVGHGTMVADLATRYATGADLVAHRIFGTSGSGASGIRESLDRAIELAKQDKLDVWNMSWGASKTVPAIDNRVNELARAGCIPVAAAGNSGGATGSPATAKYCVSVGALQEQGQRMTNFSSWDMDSQPDAGLAGVPDVAAIGKNVVGARASGTSMGRPVSPQLTVASGTSFSAPFTTGVVADLVRRQPDLSATAAVRRLEGAAANIPGTARDGLGRVDWAGAVGSSGDQPPTAQATVYTPPWATTDWIRVDADALSDGTHTVDLRALREAFE